MVRKHLIRFNLILATTAILITSSPMALVNASSTLDARNTVRTESLQSTEGDFSSSIYDSELFDKDTLRWSLNAGSYSDVKLKKGIYGYSDANMYDIKEVADSTLPISIRSKAEKEYGELYCGDIELKNRSDISKYIQTANTVYKYAEGRKLFTYYSGANDTKENIEKDKSTTYYFTAPLDGIVRFRWVHLEKGKGFNSFEHFNMIGVGILDATTNEFVSQEYSSAIDDLGSTFAYYITGTVEKGKTYKLVFNSSGYYDYSSFEMYYMNLFKNGNGTKEYKQDKTYVYASQISRVLDTAKSKKEIAERARRTTIKIDLKEKSKVTFSLLNLVNHQEEWKYICKGYEILDYTKLRKGMIKITKEVTFEGAQDLGKDWYTFSVVLDKGTYAFPVSLGDIMYDFAFKYSVTPVK